MFTYKKTERQSISQKPLIITPKCDQKTLNLSIVNDDNLISTFTLIRA